MSSIESLSYAGDLVRRYDHDRFLTTLFAPSIVRERLLTLYAFNVEIARIREIVSEPIIGQMRLQWWRDVLSALKHGDPPPKGHPVTESLAALITRYGLSMPLFMTLLDAREQDLAEAPPDTMEDLVEYCHHTSASLSLLAMETLALEDETTIEVAQSIAIAWALTGIARSVRHHALAGRVMLPKQMLDECGLAVQNLQSPETAQRAGPIIRAVANQAHQHLDRARELSSRVDLRAMPVLLPATLASRYLHTLAQSNYDMFHPKLKHQRPAIVRLWWNAWRKSY